jgi:hypothetical protein
LSNFLPNSREETVSVNFLRQSDCPGLPVHFFFAEELSEGDLHLARHRVVAGLLVQGIIEEDESKRE